MKNKIILITGWNATGKSTFANRLAERLGIPFFNQDVINETIGDKMGHEGYEVYKKGNKVLFDVP